jgi:hypothetical protein
MRTIYALIIVASLNAAAFAGPRPPALTDALLDAIRQVESSNDPNVPDGDGGKAIGQYQIWKAYWLDACEFDPSLKAGKYEDCRTDERYARRVVIAYLSRYGKGKSAKELARIHNGGPRGHRKDATLAYWSKVEDAMEDER